MAIGTSHDAEYLSQDSSMGMRNISKITLWINFMRVVLGQLARQKSHKRGEYRGLMNGFEYRLGGFGKVGQTVGF